MNLSPALKKVYTKETNSVRAAQRLAEFIAFGPVVFEVSRIMVRFGILDLLRDSEQGLTITELAGKTGKSEYAVKVLLEASLTIGTVIIDKETERFKLAYAGWFLITDSATRINMDFNHDVNYNGLFNLEEALNEGKPAGLKHFGDWPTIYEGLSSLPEKAKKSWFRFDHFYSDSSFDEALKIVFGNKPQTLLDVGGNTGRWSLRCVSYNKEVNVTILDLPQQIGLMQEQTMGKDGAERINGIGINLLDKDSQFPTDKHYDAIWMSQFLDCFGEEEIESILSRAQKIMTDDTRLYIMETLWDRQKYETAAFCLTQISLYFTAMANGNSKMYNSDDLIKIINRVGLKVEKIYDNLGHGHSILICRK